MRYWVYSDSRILGPFGREELVCVEGLNGSSLVCSETAQGLQDADWVPLASVADLSTLELARAAAPVAAGPGPAPDDPPGFEPPLHALWDVPEAGRWAEARLEAERERERELEDRVLSLREEIAAHELRQDQILEALSRKDRQLALRDKAIEELRGRLEGLERRLSGAAAPAPAPAPAPREARERAYEEILPPPAPAPTSLPAAAAAPPAPEQPMGFESPRPSPLKSTAELPGGEAFSPPVPGPAPEAPAAPRGVVVMGGEGIAREPLDLALNPPPPAAPAPPPQMPEIRVLGPGPSSGIEEMAGAAFGPPPPVLEAPPAPAPVQAQDTGVIALSPEVAPPIPEGPAQKEPAASEAREVERFEQPRTLVFGDKSEPGAEPILESLVSLSPFTPRPTQTDAARSPNAAEAIPSMTPVGEPHFPPPRAVTPAQRQTSGIGRPPTGFPPRLSRVERPSEPTSGATRGGQAGRQKIFLGVVAGAGLCLGTLLFLFLRNPRQVVQTVSMDPSDMRRRSAPAAGADASPPAAPFAAQPPDAGAATQAPAAPEKSRDFISQDQRIRALEFVKEYSLGGGRGTIEQWFKYAFPVSANAEVSWHAAALSANEYHVSYEVVKRGESGRTSKPIANYGFEVDLSAGTVSGTTPEARDLLASAGAGTSAARPAPFAPGP